MPTTVSQHKLRTRTHRPCPAYTPTVGLIQCDLPRCRISQRAGVNFASTSDWIALFVIVFATSHKQYAVALQPQAHPFSGPW